MLNVIGSLFPHGYPRPGDADNFLLPDMTAESSTSANLAHDPTQDSLTHAHTSTSTPPAARPRGRPQGSKNRPKPAHLIPPKPPKPPARRKGRPLKIRTTEELAAIEKKRSDKELGLSRGKGRPRKFEGYLVREMRLRKNRDAYLALLRRWDEGDGEGGQGGQGGPSRGMEIQEGEVNEGEEGVGEMTLGEAQGMEIANEEDYDGWGEDGQSLLDAVKTLKARGNDSSSIGMEHIRHEDADMREVFGLPAE
jgi:hypothetical protein